MDKKGLAFISRSNSKYNSSTHLLPTNSNQTCRYNPYILKQGLASILTLAICLSMTPYLHPRSKVTTSLFGTTLLVSFLVVGMPHIIPCPAPRVILADSESQDNRSGQERQRRSPCPRSDEIEKATQPLRPHAELSQEEKLTMRRKAHECPVPKPRGVLGRVLGFSEGPPPSKERRAPVQVVKDERRPDR